MRFWNALMKIGRAVLQLIARPFHVEITDELWNTFEQFIKFALVGCSNAVVTLLVYNVIVLAFGEQTYLLAQTVGYIAGIVNSFIWNSRFVFRDGGKKKASHFGKTCICYGATYFLQMGLLYGFVEYLRLSAFLSPVLAIVITTPVNFLLNKIWAFKDS